MQNHRYIRKCSLLTATYHPVVMMEYAVLILLLKQLMNTVSVGGGINQELMIIMNVMALAVKFSVYNVTAVSLCFSN